MSDLGTLSTPSEERSASSLLLDIEFHSLFRMEVTKPKPSSTTESNLMCMSLECIFSPIFTYTAHIPASIEDLTFKRMPEVGPAPDMINDDLPTNMYYLDGSFGPAAGLREIRDDDLDEFDTEDITAPESNDLSIISRVSGETIKILDAKGLEAVDDYFLNTPVDANSRPSEYVGF